MMRYLKSFVLVGLIFAMAGLLATPASAQVRLRFGVGVGPAYVGPAPVCPYGYYDYYPYACAPYGYYGPEWFVNGAFIGAGPWFHGFYGRGFYGRGFVRGRGFDRGRDFDRFAHHDFERGSAGRRFDHGFTERGGGGFRGGNSRGGYSGRR